MSKICIYKLNISGPDLLFVFIILFDITELRSCKTRKPEVITCSFADERYIKPSPDRKGCDWNRYGQSQTMQNK